MLQVKKLPRVLIGMSTAEVHKTVKAIVSAPRLSNMPKIIHEQQQ